ncbi:MAG: MFS transporter [Desulfuromonas sp.]|nr:MFS transporter [Desulfuromonas sp.]
MSNNTKLFSFGFLAINLQFALVTSIAALFFAFVGYLNVLGIPPATAGFILSADALAALIVLPLITPFVHMGTARRWLFGGAVALSVALFMVGHVSSVPLLTAARLLQGAGFICVVASLNTLAVQFIPKEMSGSAFGYISLVRLVPYAFIPLLFSFFAISPAEFGKVLNVAAVLALLPFLMLMLPPPQHVVAKEMSNSPGLAGIITSLRSGSVMVLLLSTLLFFCGYSAIFYYLKQFGHTVGIANASVFFTICTLVMIVIRLLFSRLFDACNKGLVCAAGLFIVAVCYGLLPFSSSGMFFVLAGFTGFGWGIAMPLQAAAMFDISPPAAQAMNQNLLVLMMQGGFFIGPIFGGQLISTFGYNVLFLSLAGTTLVAGLLMIRLGCIRMPTRQ